MLRGVRGAIQAAENTREEILTKSEELMVSILEANRIQQKLVTAVFFTVTPDLNGAFPAEVRKRLEWNHVSFLCGQEIAVPESLPRMIRVLILFETECDQEEIRHQYLGAAAALRPDLESVVSPASRRHPERKN